MKDNVNYKVLRSKLDEVLAKLELSETDDIDELISLHTQALDLINELEAKLESAAQAAKKSK